MTKIAMKVSVLPLLLAVAACGGREGTAATTETGGEPVTRVEAPLTGDVPGGDVPVSSDGYGDVGEAPAAAQDAVSGGAPPNDPSVPAGPAAQPAASAPAPEPGAAASQDRAA
jgi:hypothetical protein